MVKINIGGKTVDNVIKLVGHFDAALAHFGYLDHLYAIRILKWQPVFTVGCTILRTSTPEIVATVPLTSGQWAQLANIQKSGKVYVDAIQRIETMLSHAVMFTPGQKNADLGAAVLAKGVTFKPKKAPLGVVTVAAEVTKQANPNTVQPESGKAPQVHFYTSPDGYWYWTDAETLDQKAEHGGFICKGDAEKDYANALHLKAKAALKEMQAITLEGDTPFLKALNAVKKAGGAVRYGEYLFLKNEWKVSGLDAGLAAMTAKNVFSPPVEFAAIDSAALSVGAIGAAKTVAGEWGDANPSFVLTETQAKPKVESGSITSATEGLKMSVAADPVLQETMLKNAKLPPVLLKNATVLGQPALGTSKGSIYTVMAIRPGMRVAVRRSSGKLAVRAEGPGLWTDSMSARFLECADLFNFYHGSHVSAHIHVTGVREEIAYAGLLAALSPDGLWVLAAPLHMLP